MSNAESLPKDADRDHRLKQLEFLRTHSEAQATRLLQGGNLLNFAHGGALATGAILLKDLKTRFDENLVIFAMIVFLIGLINSGLFSIVALGSENTVRRKLIELSLNDDDISVMRDVWKVTDSEKILNFCLAFSLLSFFVGIIIVLISLVR